MTLLDNRKKMLPPTPIETRTPSGQWQKGVSGQNPSGRPRGARSKLSEEIILAAFSTDFAKHGADVIERVRVEHPEQYLAIIARLVPKEFQLGEVRDDPIEAVSDEELTALIADVRSMQGKQD